MRRPHLPVLHRPGLAPLVALPVVIVALVGIIGTSTVGDAAVGGAAGGGDGISIAGFAFGPSTLEVDPGTEVVWTNLDTASHSIADGDGLFGESDTLGEGDEFRFTYDEPGRYPYFCGIHQYMRGEVVVSG